MMQSAKTAIEIMRLTASVYECDKLETGQNTESFKTIKDVQNPKRYIRFGTDISKNTQYLQALAQTLKQTVPNAFIEMYAVYQKDKNSFVLKNEPQSGTLSSPCIFIDLEKIDSSDDRHMLLYIIEDTAKKMNTQKTITEYQEKLKEARQKSNKFRAAIQSIKEKSDETKPGLFSKNFDTLKHMIDMESRNS